ncbi:MAG TPA: hypothetical protein VNT60_08235 [Deinococcales bacterium]|nr:hypothetical protein [Deinococcales bacterium]
MSVPDSGAEVGAAGLQGEQERLQAPAVEEAAVGGGEGSHGGLVGLP